MMLFEKLKLKLKKTLLLLLLPPVLLTGCGATLPPCAPASQPLPAPPSISTQLPQESYSARAQRNISGWQNKLTSTLLMSDY